MTRRGDSWQELVRRGDDVRWSDLSERQRRTIVVVGAVELVLTATALWDLSRRTDDEVRGSRARWVPVVFVQPVGSLLYLLWGRRPSA